jgi:hypothetical protein
LSDFVIRSPHPEELKLSVLRAEAAYGRPYTPPAFRFPGKIADMAAVGDIFALVVADAVGHIGGAIFRQWDRGRVVRLFGPYVFGLPSDSGAAERLVEECISTLAKTPAVGILSEYPTQDLPKSYFEPLGCLRAGGSKGDPDEPPAQYRHLQEDSGAGVWAHPSIEPFLRTEYARLVFAREILSVRDDGEECSPFAVLSAEFDRPRGTVRLHPVWWGADSAKTVTAYVETLKNEGFDHILFTMDTGKPWHARFAPALLAEGFEPRIVLPHAGKGDVVVFQHATEENES